MTKSLLPVAKNGVPRSGCEPNRNNFRLYFPLPGLPLSLLNDTRIRIDKAVRVS